LFVTEIVVSLSMSWSLPENAALTAPAAGHDWLLPGLSDLAEQLRRVIPQSTTLLLVGETGTGKSRLARHIHELSPRRHEPFAVLDCGVLSPNLIESEMFGHVEGAFTGADADRAGKLSAAGAGTLLLDEVNALPMSLQGKLLRAVDDRVFEPVGSDDLQPLAARIIAISNVPLDEEVAAGRFRGDLFYRLNVLSFHLPPLRRRREAIVPLATHMLREACGGRRANLRGFSPKALALLESYDWPGNIRELHNAIERAVALAPGPWIEPADLPVALRGPRSAGRLTPVTPPDLAGAERGAPPKPQSLNLSQSKEQVEIFRIADALRRHRNNRLRAAAELGISRMSLYKKLHKYGLMHVTPA
jgi:DNA-binding NtrC family response regulator